MVALSSGCRDNAVSNTDKTGWLAFRRRTWTPVPSRCCSACRVPLLLCLVLRLLRHIWPTSASRLGIHISLSKAVAAGHCALCTEINTAAESSHSRPQSCLIHLDADSLHSCFELCPRPDHRLRKRMGSWLTSSENYGIFLSDFCARVGFVLTSSMADAFSRPLESFRAASQRRLLRAVPNIRKATWSARFIPHPIASEPRASSLLCPDSQAR